MDDRNPIFGDEIITVTIDDDACGGYIVLTQNEQTIKVDPEELQLIAKTAIICAQIYIARNISLSEKDVLSALTEIDKLYREENHN